MRRHFRLLPGLALVAAGLLQTPAQAKSAPSTLWLDQSSYSATEASTSSVVVKVLRSSSQGTASVTFATSDGSATAGVDYTAVDTTASFKNGQSEVDEHLPILDDMANENGADQSFNVTLSHPKGAVVGSPSSAVVTIHEDNSPAPPNPTNVTATAVSSSEIDVSWDAASGASYYSVYSWERQNPGCSVPPSVLPPPATTTSTTVRFTGLTASNTYCFDVHANNDDNASTGVLVSATTSPASGLATPTNLKATTVSSTEIDLSWSAVAGASSYNLAEGVCNSAFPPEVGSTTQTSAAYTNLTPATTYCFSVQAVGGGAVSSWAPVVSATTDSS